MKAISRHLAIFSPYSNRTKCAKIKKIHLIFVSALELKKKQLCGRSLVAGYALPFAATQARAAGIVDRIRYCEPPAEGILAGVQDFGRIRQDATGNADSPVRTRLPVEANPH